MFCGKSRHNEDILIYNSTRDLPEEWNSFFKGKFCLQLPYLNAIERNHTDKMDFRYAILKDEDEIKFASYFQIVDFSGNELKDYIPPSSFNGFLYKFNQGFNRFLSCQLNHIKWKLLVSGNLFVTGDSGFQFNSSVKGEDHFAMIRDVIRFTVNNMPEKERINAILLKDIYYDQTEGDSVLLKNSYNRFKIEQDMIFFVNPDWNTFDDYLSSVSSKYRVRAKKVLKTSSHIERRELDLYEIESKKEKLFSLYMNVASNAPFNLVYLTPAYFPSIKKAMGKNFRIFGYYIDNELISFVSVFRLNEHIEVSYVGLDYKLNKEFSIYQRMLYDNIELGITGGVKKIHYGRTAPEIKSTVGAKPIDMYCYLKHTNPLSNFIIKPLTSYLKPKEWIARDPFKEKAYDTLY